MNVHPAGAQIGRQQEHTGSSLLSTLYIEMDIKVLTQPVFQMANECVNLSQRGVGGRRVPSPFLCCLFIVTCCSPGGSCFSLINPQKMTEWLKKILGKKWHLEHGTNKGSTDEQQENDRKYTCTSAQGKSNKSQVTSETKLDKVLNDALSWGFVTIIQEEPHPKCKACL